MQTSEIEDNLETHYEIKFSVKLDKNTTETYEMFSSANALTFQPALE